MYEFFDGQFDQNGQISFKDEEEEAQLMDWIIYDYKFANGKKLIENYIDDNADKLSPKERKLLEEMLLNKYGFFEVKSVEPEKFIILESLHSGKDYRVEEKLGTRGVTIGNILVCRVGKQGDSWRMIGSNPTVVPVQLSKDARVMFKNDKKPLTPKDFRRLKNC